MVSQDPSSDSDHDLIDEAIAEYLRAEAAGKAGNRQHWLDRYPACAEELAEFLDDREGLDRMMMPVRMDQQIAAINLRAAESIRPVDVPEPTGADGFIPEPPQLTTTPYRALRFLARGRMSEIWLAIDERIGRQVALKVLRSVKDYDHARFMAEAQIIGQLEHPGILPLHDLGADDAGQPFYVMTYVEGRRLTEAIAECHKDKSSSAWPSGLAFRRLLDAFVSVCNIVAFAHHKGVLHRDIKPDNIMLGPYGETLVVDWGLAKLIDQAEAVRGSDMRLGGKGSAETRNRATAGAPHSLAPDGAEGCPDAVDQASDVYLLGATLYEILTARPPRRSSSSWELIDLALHSRPTTPRKIDARVPRPLEAICLKAMSYNKQDRYETSIALAEDIERYLADQPTLAYREPLLKRVKRWTRRHRRGIS
jgi:eukaryotic-like serine/threonine-protein kinase